MRNLFLYYVYKSDKTSSVRAFYVQKGYSCISEFNPFYLFPYLTLYSLIIIIVKLLFSEHILCKESITVVKKFDFEILTYLYVLKSPEFIYAMFMVMYACVYVSEYDIV